MIKLLTVTEASKVLRINRNSVYKLIHAGDLKAVDINGLKIPEENLEIFITSRTLRTETVGKEDK